MLGWESHTLLGYQLQYSTAPGPFGVGPNLERHPAVIPDLGSCIS